MARWIAPAYAIGLFLLVPSGAGVVAAPRHLRCPPLDPAGERALARNSGGCAALPDGILSLRVVRVAKTKCEGGLESKTGRAVLSLVRLDPRGKNRETVLSAPQALATNLVDYSCIGDSHGYVRLAGAGDLDGDGAPELMLLLVKGAHEDFARPTLEIWSMRGDTLVRYPHDPKLPTTFSTLSPEKIAASLVRDLDGDGRPDLLHPGPYVNIKVPQRSLIGEVPVPNRFAYHARPDGTFHNDDAIAKRYLQSYCGKIPPHISDKPNRGEDNGLVARLVRRIICVRAYGVSAKSLLTELTPKCPVWNAVDYEDEPAPAELVVQKAQSTCPEWLLDLIKIQPPLQL